MATARKCDICGILYEEYNKLEDRTKSNGIAEINIGYKSNYYSNKVLDLCPSCLASYEQWKEARRSLTTIGEKENA